MTKWHPIVEVFFGGYFNDERYSKSKRYRCEIQSLITEMYDEGTLMTARQFNEWRRSLKEIFDNIDEERYRNDRQYQRKIDSLSLEPHEQTYDDYWQETVATELGIRKWQKSFQRVTGLVLIFMGLVGMAQMVTGNTLVAWTLPEDYTSYPNNLIMSFLFIWAYLRLAVFPSLIVGGVYCLLGRKKVDKLMNRIFDSN